MKTKFLTGLAFAAALLVAGPAFAGDNHSVRGGGHAAGRPVAHRAATHTYAAVHRSAPARTLAAAHTSRVARPAAAIASRRTVAAPASRSYAVNRNVNRNVTRNVNSNVTRNVRTSVAYGGNGNYAQGGNNSHGQYAFASHDGWVQGRQYDWNGHHYGWYGNGWYIIDPFYAGYSPGYYNSGSVGVEVQQALNQQGYYQGPIDGIIGQGTSAAIAAYQRDNGLRVTGTITRGLLRDLGVG